MMETISAMFGDTLWIYTAIAGALLGAAFLAWYKETNMGLWTYAKFDGFLDYLARRWGWTELHEPVDAWRKEYPKITMKIDTIEERLERLEAWSHPEINLQEIKTALANIEARLDVFEKTQRKKK